MIYWPQYHNGKEAGTNEPITEPNTQTGPRCSGRGAARLAAFVEETYGVRPGGVSASGRFTYRITGCMKNCPNGPSLRWDGALHSRADESLIRALVDEGGGRPSP